MHDTILYNIEYYQIMHIAQCYIQLHANKQYYYCYTAPLQDEFVPNSVNDDGKQTIRCRTIVAGVKRSGWGRGSLGCLKVREMNREEEQGVESRLAIELRDFGDSCTGWTGLEPIEMYYQALTSCLGVSYAINSIRQPAYNTKRPSPRSVKLSALATGDGRAMQPYQIP